MNSSREFDPWNLLGQVGKVQVLIYIDIWLTNLVLKILGAGFKLVLISIRNEMHPPN